MLDYGLMFQEKRWWHISNAYVIKRDKTTEFIQFLNAHKKPSNYWEECYKAKSAFSREQIEKMKKMCNGDTEF